MTQDFSVEYDQGADLLSLGQGYRPASDNKPQNSWHTYKTKDENVIRGELILRDLSGGLNRVLGDVLTDSNRVASSTMDTSYPGYATNPFLLTAGSVYQQSESVCHANVFSTLVFGAGSTANHCLLKETSGTDPTLLEITYTPGSKIISLTPVTGLGSTAEKLIVGRAGAAAHVLGDVTTGGPTVFGTMHGDTTALWGTIVAPGGINVANPGTPLLLLYANGGIRSLDASSAVGTQPTLVSTMRNGGYAIGIVALKSLGGVARAFWWEPDVDTGTTTALPIGAAMTRGRIVHTNLEGSDKQELSSSFQNGMYWAVRLNGNTIAATDTQRVTLYGADEEDLGFDIQATTNLSNINGATYQPTGNFAPRCGGMWTANGVLYALSVVGITGYDLLVQKYDGKNWHRVSVNVSSQNANSFSGGPWAGSLYGYPLGALPFSRQTNYLHILPLSTAGTKLSYWQRVNPTSGTPFWNGVSPAPPSFDLTGLAYTVAMLMQSTSYSIPPLEGLPAVLEEIIWPNDATTAKIPSGGYIEFSVGYDSLTSKTLAFDATGTGISKRFATDAMYQNRQTFPDNKTSFTRLALRIVNFMGAGPTVGQTANVLPVIVRVLIFLNRNVKAPRECGPGVSWCDY